MWELCCEPLFQNKWINDDIQWNYIPDFREVMNVGIRIAQSGEDRCIGRGQFFVEVSRALGGCEQVESWFRPQGPGLGNRIEIRQAAEELKVH